MTGEDKPLAREIASRAENILGWVAKLGHMVPREGDDTTDYVSLIEAAALEIIAFAETLQSDDFIEEPPSG